MSFELTITEASALDGPLPRLTVKALMKAPTWSGYAGVPVNWLGSFALTHEPVPASQGLPHGSGVAMLAARLLTGERFFDRIFQGGRIEVVFEADVPREAGAWIERFRAGRPLYLRVDGQIQVLAAGHGRDPANGATSLFEQFAPNSSFTLTWPLRSSSHELSRDLWCSKILPVLQGSGRALIEIPMGPIDQPNPTARETVDFLKQAQRAIDLGHYPEAMKAIYNAEERMRDSDVVDVYGRKMTDAIDGVRKALGRLSNGERHAGHAIGETGRTDRALALAALAAATGLAAVYFQEGATVRERESAADADGS